ncbi:MAG TPA: hypothetical protein VFZ76_14195, partial [Anaerolineales bacterium]
MPDALLTFNGINGASGAYLLAPMRAEDLTRVASGERLDYSHLQELDERYRRTKKHQRAVKEGVDPKDLAQTGWGVIFAHHDEEQTPAILEALAPLLDLRRSQSGELFNQYQGVDAYRPGETKTQFLARHGAGPGPADPEVVPYYLLIVASPDSIPFSFQYQLDVQYAVGRIYFDELEAYAHYARSVVAMENGHTVLPRRATFFGVHNPDDPATDLSAHHLVEPLAARLAADQKDRGWDFQTVIGDQASKANLGKILGGDQTPALLFTSSHGMGFPKDDPRQVPHQGALLCQDWPGPHAWRGAIPEEHYFSANDLGAQASIQGLIGFHFACYSAGTPRLDDFAHLGLQEPAEIASRPFLAQLPQKMLGHPNGGALAVIGHVERAWGYAFHWDRAGDQLAVFESTLKRLMEGHPVGSAFEYFNTRYAELSTVLSDELRGMRFGKRPDHLELAGMWTANNDARSYAIIGDPAVRLPVEQPSQGEAQQPAAIARIDTYPEPALTVPESPPMTPIAHHEAEPMTAVAAESGGGADQSRERLSSSLQQLADQLRQWLENAVDQTQTISVQTYIQENNAPGEADIAGHARLLASTRIENLGDTILVLPEEAGDQDDR